jgi:selenocysteine lyase/cysteine desulfurase
MDNDSIIYLDNAATTFPKPEAVYREMDSFYRNYGGNAGRGANPLARKAQALVNETREMLQVWLDAPNVTFSPSATIALNTVIFGARLRRGDVVYVTPFEHNSVLRPLEHLRKTIGIEVRVIPFDKRTFACDTDKARAQFRLEPPTMMCVTQVSNVFGIMPPVDTLAEYARSANPNVIVVVDGAQAAGLKLLNMVQIDALIFSGHKSLYGPYGVAGIAYGRNWRPEPFIHGGTGTQSESIEMPIEGPARFEAGSQNVIAIAGLYAALCWLQEIGRDTLNSRIDELTKTLYSVLAMPNIRTYTQNSYTSYTGIVSFNVEGVSPQAMEIALGANNIAVRAGLHCAPWAHEFGGTKLIGGTIRVSVGYSNTYSDLDKLHGTLSETIAQPY